MREYPKPQEIYRHFKGNCYQVITLARNVEDGEKMIVYQQLYAPFEICVRPLERFMRKIDVRKYPNETQVYRFERIDSRGEHTQEQKPEVQKAVVTKEQEEAQPEPALAPGLMAFLDADSYERKLEILSMLHPTITDEMIDTMAVSLDTEIKDGDIEQRYSDIKNCLITMERFECNRLR
ncbi:MAG: DUF1653 domain-containing protein [Lachnospiraceae bacterium]|jgi:hypothetical protein|nr:DUF1653 domain-containing protein [Lachnospiraceae bacterium]MCI9400174.1 DUF1653 domain-containing protein [Lachnospiraceae bacterium]MCX4375477.1 DUF1653 domain-containing protein [Lachnospiraceae bacterium]